MRLSQRRAAARIVVTVALALTVTVAHAATDIGAATAITTSVTGTLDSRTSVLRTGDHIFANQTVTTDASGVGQFQFRDKTKLAVGPGSTVVIDNFIFDSNSSGSKVVLDLARGSFRFITGKARHDAYEIVTPTATIGVRGTAFDLYVGDTGDVAVAMIDGAIEVCPRNAACRLHDVIGRFLHMTRDGLFSLHDTWDGTLPGIAFKAALPFLDDQRLLTPALRGQTKIVARYAGGAASAVEKAVRAICPPRLPTLKLPNPFK